METVQNGFYVQLGVSLFEKRPNALFLARLEKEKPPLPIRLWLTELRCMMIYI